MLTPFRPWEWEWPITHLALVLIWRADGCFLGIVYNSQAYMDNITYSRFSREDLDVTSDDGLIKAQPQLFLHGL